MRRVLAVFLLIFALGALGNAILMLAPLVVARKQFALEMEPHDRVRLMSSSALVAAGSAAQFQAARRRYLPRDAEPGLALVWLVLALGCLAAARRLMPGWRLPFGVLAVVSAIGGFSIAARFEAVTGGGESLADNPFALALRAEWVSQRQGMFHFLAVVLLILGALLIANHVLSARRLRRPQPAADTTPAATEVSRLVGVMADKDTEELMALLAARDGGEYSAAAYAAMEQVLRQRGSSG